MDGVGSRGQRDLGGSCSHAPTGPRAAAPRRRRVGPSGRPPQPQRLRWPHAHLQSHLRGPLCPSKRTRTDVHLSGLAGPSWDMTAAIPNRAEAPRAPPSTCTVPEPPPNLAFPRAPTPSATTGPGEKALLSPRQARPLPQRRKRHREATPSRTSVSVCLKVTAHFHWLPISRNFLFLPKV